jgi:hypothetical protein
MTLSRSHSEQRGGLARWQWLSGWPTCSMTKHDDAYCPSGFGTAAEGTCLDSGSAMRIQEFMNSMTKTRNPIGGSDERTITEAARHACPSPIGQAAARHPGPALEFLREHLRGNIPCEGRRQFSRSTHARGSADSPRPLAGRPTKAEAAGRVGTRRIPHRDRPAGGSEDAQQTRIVVSGEASSLTDGSFTTGPASIPRASMPQWRPWPARTSQANACCDVTRPTEFRSEAELAQPRRLGRNSGTQQLAD